MLEILANDGKTITWAHDWFAEEGQAIDKAWMDSGRAIAIADQEQPSRQAKRDGQRRAARPDARRRS